MENKKVKTKTSKKVKRKTKVRKKTSKKVKRKSSSTTFKHVKKRW